VISEKGNPRMNKKIVVVILIVISSFLPFASRFFNLDPIINICFIVIGLSFAFFVVLIQGNLIRNKKGKIEDLWLYVWSYVIPIVLFIIFVK